MLDGGEECLIVCWNGRACGAESNDSVCKRLSGFKSFSLVQRSSSLSKQRAVALSGSSCSSSSVDTHTVPQVSIRPNRTVKSENHFAYREQRVPHRQGLQYEALGVSFRKAWLERLAGVFSA